MTSASALDNKSKSAPPHENGAASSGPQTCRPAGGKWSPLAAGTLTAACLVILSVLVLTGPSRVAPAPRPFIYGPRDRGSHVAPGAVRWYLARTKADIQAALSHIRRGIVGEGVIVGDGESGPGVQYSFGPWMPSTMALGAADDPALTRRFARWAGQGFRLLGLDLVLAPVADVFETSAPAFIGWRSLGGNPERVAVHAREYAEGLIEGGVVPVIKHFPGHGITPIDTHDNPGVSPLSFEEVWDRHASAFSFLRGQGGRYAVMFGHLATGDRGHYDLAAASSVWHRVLREKLGFDGVTMTDSVNMQAVQLRNGGEPRFTVDALRQGVDLILEPSQSGLDYRAYTSALQTGVLSTPLLNASQKRIERLLETVRALRKNPLPPEEQWLREGEVLARDVLEAGSVVFGQAPNLSGGSIDAANLRMIGERSEIRIDGLLEEAGLGRFTSVPRLNPETDVPTSGSHWVLIYWRPGTGNLLATPWTDSELDWIRRAGSENVQVSVLVLGNPLAGVVLKDWSQVRGVVVWGRSPASCRAAGAWLAGRFAPRGSWPFSTEGVRAHAP